MTPERLLEILRGRGMWPVLNEKGEIQMRGNVAELTDDLRSTIRIRSNYEAIVQKLKGGADEQPKRPCPSCKHELDDKGRCWKCHWRLCRQGCGRTTGSAFINTCILCQHKNTVRNAGDLEGASEPPL